MKPEEAVPSCKSEYPIRGKRYWADPANYKKEWGNRSRLAASLVPDKATVLEVGVGTGTFKNLVKGRTTYVGADLQPLDTESLTLDLDWDPLPPKRFDYVVLLGVFGYLKHAESVAKKLCDAADRVIISYCCRQAELHRLEVVESRMSMGWVNNFDQAEFVQLFARHGHVLALSIPLAATSHFENFLMEFRSRDSQCSGRR